MHGHIQSILKEQFSLLAAAQMPPILYGGSVKEDNAESILGLDNVGGALVGGASLSADGFASIVSLADQVS